MYAVRSGFFVCRYIVTNIPICKVGITAVASAVNMTVRGHLYGCRVYHVHKTL